MLFCLGALSIEVAPFNVEDATRETGFDFAPKDIMDAQRPREPTGEADEKIVFRGKLFPHRLNGLDELEQLHGMRRSGQPQILVRGDGANLGWYLVEKVHEHSQHLNQWGVGRQIEVTIDLVKSPNAPSAESLLGQLLSLFG